MSRKMDCMHGSTDKSLNSWPTRTLPPSPSSFGGPLTHFCALCRDDVLNAAFLEPGEKDDLNIFVDAMRCDPRPAETYKIKRQRWTMSEGAGAEVYQVIFFPFPGFITGNALTPRST
jgi:hypothetical protein